MNRRANVKGDFSVHEAVVLTGFSKYMLDYLAREEIFEPTGREIRRRGIRRVYSFDDVVLLRALFAICNGKGKIRHLKASLRRFREEFGSITAAQRLERCLFVHGDELCVRSNEQVARQLSTGQMLFSFVVDLASIEKEVSNNVVIDSSMRKTCLVPRMALRAEQERQRHWEAIRLRRLKARNGRVRERRSLS
jgi:hypothetical protein